MPLRSEDAQFTFYNATWIFFLSFKNNFSLKFLIPIIITSSMTNSDKFLEYYNKIDLYLKREGNYENHQSYAYKVKNSTSGVVKRFKDELLTFGELRNAIIHHPLINGEPIAEPHTQIVNRIKTIAEHILNPKKVIPTFQFEVFSAHFNEYINPIVHKMGEFSFSQAPIIDDQGKIIEIITTNTIARWLSSCLESNGTLLLENVKVKDLIPYIENAKNYCFLNRDASIYDAYQLFVESFKRNKCYLDTIFLTNSGNQYEKILGLITINDIANHL